MTPVLAVSIAAVAKAMSEPLPEPEPEPDPPPLHFCNGGHRCYCPNDILHGCSEGNLVGEEHRP